MFLNELQNAIKVCIAADIAPSIAGHRGIGKTQVVKQIAANWTDSWMEKGQKGIPMFALYCATQDVTDLVGFPIQTWESDETPVIRGMASKVEGDRIVTTWAEPGWAARIKKHCILSEESDRKIRDQMIVDNATADDIHGFWHRPKAIVFLDEIKRAPREVMQAMYPFVLDKTLHMHEMPRGTRVVTADNYAGAYDLREPDEAFMSRFCHLDAECDTKTWLEWAVANNIHPRVRGFIASSREMLMSVPNDQEKASVKYLSNPDPRSWVMVNNIEKYGRLGLPGVTYDVQNLALKTAIRGVVGLAAAEGYWKYSDKAISMEDILTGKAKIKTALSKYKSDVEANKLKEKLLIESSATLKNRKYNDKEAERLKIFLVDLNSKDKAVAILQSILLMKNQNELDARWVTDLMQGKELMELIKHLVDKKNV